MSSRPTKKKKKKEEAEPHAPSIRKPYVKANPNKKWEVFCIKTGLKSLFKRGSGIGKGKTAKNCRWIPARTEHIKELSDLIRKTVLEVSRWTIEAGLNIHFHFAQLLASGDRKAIREEFIDREEQPKKREYIRFFHQLQTIPASSAPKMNARYDRIRRDNKMPSYNQNVKANIHLYAADQYMVNFKTNVTTHARAHVTRFLRRLYPTRKKEDRKKLNDTISHLFFSTSTAAPDKQMMQRVKKVLDPPKTLFRNLTSNWYACVPSLWRLQRFNEANELRNFKLFPQYSHGRKAIEIDTQSMVRLINEIAPIDQRLSQKTQYAQTWSPWINYFKHETKNHHFDFRLITDHVFGALQMAREKREAKSEATVERENRAFRNSIRDKLIRGEYKRVGGIDEGGREMVACNSSYTATPFIGPRKELFAKYKARSFQFDSGQLYFKRKYHAFTRDVLRAKETDRRVFELMSEGERSKQPGYIFTQSLIDADLQKKLATRRKRNAKRMKKLKDQAQKKPASVSKRQKKQIERHEKLQQVDKRHQYELSAKSWNYIDYVRFELKHFDAVQTCLEHDDLARYKFKAGIIKTIHTHNIARETAAYGGIRTPQLGEPRVLYRQQDKAYKKRRSTKRKRKEENLLARQNLIYLGNLQMAGNSPMAGHPRTSLGDYNKSLQQRCDVLYIDEFRTTQVCSACHTRAETSKPPHRFQQCMCDGKRRVSLIFSVNLLANNTNFIWFSFFSFFLSFFRFGTATTTRHGT